jgi:hypothetical protein
MEVKPVIAVGCLFAALALFIAGTATGATVKTFSGGYKVEYTLWAACVTVPGGGGRQCVDPLAGMCKATADTMRAARAFDILSIITAGVCAILAALAAFVPAAAAVARVPWGLVGGAAGAIFSVIAWALTVSLYTVGQCGSEAVSKTKVMDLGPNVPLYVVGCFLCIVAAVVSFLNRGAAKTADAV